MYPGLTRAVLFTEDNLPFDINEVKSPYDYMKLFISEELVDKTVSETKRCSSQQNCPAFQATVDIDIIRASHVIMMMSGYLSPTKRRMYWEKREDTENPLIKKAMSRNTFDNVMRYTHFANNQRP